MGGQLGGCSSLFIALGLILTHMLTITAVGELTDLVCELGAGAGTPSHRPCELGSGACMVLWQAGSGSGFPRQDRQGAWAEETPETSILPKECSELLFRTEHRTHMPDLLQGWPSLLGQMLPLWGGQMGRAWKGDTQTTHDPGIRRRGCLG